MSTKKKDTACPKIRSFQEIHQRLRELDSEEVHAFAAYREVQSKCFQERRDLMHELNWWWLENQKGTP